MSPESKVLLSGLSIKRLLTMRFLIILVIALSLVLIKVFWISSDPIEASSSIALTGTPTQNSTIAPQPAEDQISTKAQYKALVLSKLPPSLQDTGEPAKLTIDDTGKLIIDNNLRKLADFYLSALGEEPLEDVMIRIEAAIHSQLSPLEAEKALKLVKGYVDFKQQLGNRMQEFQDMWTEGLSLDAIIAVREKVNAERAQFLPLEAIEAFFGKEDAYNEFSNQRHSILTNKDLSDADKQQQLEVLLSQQPEWLQAQQHPEQQLSAYQAFQERISSAENKKQLMEDYRQNQFDQETNQRLKALDRQRERWKTRLNNYALEKKELLAFQHDETLYAEKLTQLKQACFTKPEILRVEALERLGKI